MFILSKDETILEQTETVKKSQLSYLETSVNSENVISVLLVFVYPILYFTFLITYVSE
jgi:hypothetical protein